MQTIILKETELPYEIAEELKSLRTNILFSGVDKKVILVTSCVSGEGKSSVTLNLARSLQELGKKVMLIDTDIRKSVLDQRIGVKGLIGISHYLSGQFSEADAVCHVVGTDMDIITAGKSAPNPTELLGNERMKKLIEDSREAYDYVIVDSAPLGLVVDAAVVAGYCDACILLIESGSIAYPFAQEVVEKLQTTKCPLLGVILNKVDSTEKSAYGKYGKYGKYGRYSKYEKYGA